MPLEELPWTFKEAINVAHALGFRWHWIDALCTLQDSKEDQGHEIIRIDSVFRSSVLTLFATAGNNADAGLSAEHDPRLVKPCIIKLKTTLDGKTVESQTFIYVIIWAETLVPCSNVDG